MYVATRGQIRYGNAKEQQWAYLILCQTYSNPTVNFMCSACQDGLLVE